MKKHQRFQPEKLKKGIFLLPNLFTTLNIFGGFYAVIAAINGEFVTAAVAIMVAAVFDLLDGKIARATHTTSRFGVEYDSLADVISFGLAPGLMTYLWALKPMGRIGWLAAFLFMVCGALRLARFNTQVGSISSDYFNGLPIPGAAGMMCATVLFFDRLNISGSEYPVFVLILMYALSFLMVSTVKYYSFKKAGFFHKTNFYALVAVVLVLVFIASQPSIALFLVGITYLFSGFFSNAAFQRQRESKNTLPRELEKPELPGA